MTTLRQFTCDDLFRFNPINLDPLTETYGVGFYLQYLARWPEYFLVAESPGGDLMGYIMGKAEGKFCRLSSPSRSKSMITSANFIIQDLSYTCHTTRISFLTRFTLIGNGNNWHGHVTAVTCAPAHRRLGLAGRLMDALEKISEQKKCMFVDLFVRVSNTVAITMYKVKRRLFQDKIKLIVFMFGDSRSVLSLKP